MLSQNIEAVYSATYVENYLESVENLPDDVQKYLSRIREIDVQYRGYLRDLDHCMSSHKNEQNDSVIMTAEKTRFMNKIQKNLIAAQELGDEKLQIVNQLQELIDHKTRQLDHDFKNLDYGKDEPMAIIAEVISKEVRAPSPVVLPSVPTNNSTTVQPILTTATSVVSSAVAAVISPVVLPSSAVLSNSSSTSSNNTNNSNNERSSKRVRRTRTETGTGSEISTPEIPSVAVTVEPPPIIKPVVTQSAANAIQKKGTGSGKKKKRKTRGAQGNGGSNNQSNARDTRDDTPPVEEPIDPDEPTYCLCDQISFGEMILCDNDLCPIEWFHFSCVSLMSKPKGKWFCPNCRGDRPNVMKPKAQFLKELERYNKEKEEKT